MSKKDTDIPFYKLPIEPDKELLTWEKWIQVRKEETKTLGKYLQKPPVDLAMNELWKIREDKERKTVLEHAQIEKRPTVRDTLWDQAPRLQQKKYYDAVYELHRTAAEMGKPIIIEHVSVPKYIQETEMGMAGPSERKPCHKLDSEYRKHRSKREIEWKEKIIKIDPFGPAASELMIRGTKPKTPPPKLPPLPVISVISPDPADGFVYSIYALRINDTVFYKNTPGILNLDHLKQLQKEPWHKNCTSWTYYFNCTLNKVCRSELFLENLGTITLRYCWKRIKRPIPFIPDDTNEQVFFFNKNEDVLSPGQKKIIYFNFVSENPGIFTEIWELNMCNICFFDTLADKLTINLSADAYLDPDRRKRKIDTLKTRLYKKTVKNMARALVNEAFEKVFVTEPQIYPYKKLFLEAEFFIMKNPVCFYHQTEVANMKVMYTEMVKGNTWDLSIGCWREAMMVQEFEERMNYYERLRKSHTELLKPWYEGEDLKKEKHRAVKLLLKQLANNMETEYNRLQMQYSYINKNYNASGTNTITNYSKMSQSRSSTVLDPLARQEIRNLFYLYTYEHVATTMELCAGVLSSLDLNRWIDFNFC